LNYNGINKIKHKYGQDNKELAVKAPVVGLDNLVAKQQQEQNGAYLVNIRESQSSVDSVVKQHSEYEREERQVEKLSVNSFLHFCF
jgi:hypothetical protein